VKLNDFGLRLPWRYALPDSFSFAGVKVIVPSTLRVHVFDARRL
jgi:hypothetical protein